MGKGLSELQKEILRTGHRNRLKYGPDVLNREILISVYGFVPMVSPENARPGAMIFSRSLEGLERYKAATVAVVRSIGSLEKRGLAERDGPGEASLTPAGVEVAEGLIG